jgi:hypothetical protein
MDEEQKKVAAKAAVDKVLRHIETMPESAQQHILECGMRMRGLACFYGPYFTLALSLTGCEIAAGLLVMPAKAECDRANEIMLAGGKRPEDLGKIILPDTKH